MIRRLLSTKAQETRDISFSDIWRKGLDVTSLNTVAGEPVTYDTAMSLSAVYASIRLLAERMIVQLVEIMPELKDVGGWHSTGQRRSLDELGRVFENRISEDMLFHYQDGHQE